MRRLTAPEPVGYDLLIKRYDLAVPPHWHRSAIGHKSERSITQTGGVTHTTFPPRFRVGDSLGEQLQFALKYDGVNLQILARLFEVVPVAEWVRYITARPGSKYSRRVWYWYEFVRGEALPIADLAQGNYIDLLDRVAYYTTSGDRHRRRPRQRIIDNMPGCEQFCPTVRRTPRLKRLEGSGLDQRCKQVVSQYPADVLRRALSYLYTKETKSSYEIESETPSRDRTERFIALLRAAEREDYCSKHGFIKLQNNIVDTRFKETDYRSAQNYVGQSVGRGREHVHFVPPRPDDVGQLMAGLVSAHEMLCGPEGRSLSAVIHAAIIAFGFVFIHPFEDGNGRSHRFLIHNILSRGGFTPPGVIFPVSAAMLRKRELYDASLEAFSTPLTKLIDYQLDDQGRMTVQGDTRDYYRFADLTAQAEALFEFIKEAIEVDLVDELTFLQRHDRARKQMREVVDLPDRLADQFIGFCDQNAGRVSKAKREKYLAMLSDAEIAGLEAAVASADPERDRTKVIE